MKWVIEYNKGCGPLRFGMSQSEVAEILGPADDQNQFEFDKIIVDESRDDNHWHECRFENKKLACISAYPNRLQNLFVDSTNILDLPTLKVVEIFAKANGSVSQAMGGSLYFDNIGVCILQFEIPHIREITLLSDDHDHGEGLREISLQEAKSYYKELTERDPDTDNFGSIDSA